MKRRKKAGRNKQRGSEEARKEERIKGGDGGRKEERRGTGRLEGRYKKETRGE